MVGCRLQIVIVVQKTYQIKNSFFVALQLCHFSPYVIIANLYYYRQLMEYEKFPEPQDIKSQDKKFTVGMNKSKRTWKLGVNRKPTKCTVSRGPQVTWEEKKKRAEELKQLRNQVREFKAKKIAKRKEIREARKERKKQKELNEVRAGKFEVVKNTKNMKKWSKKIKSQLVKLPAEIFENLLHKRD